MSTAHKIAAKDYVKLLVQDFLRAHAVDYQSTGRDMLAAADFPTTTEQERASLLATAARQYEKAEACLEFIRDLEKPQAT